MREPGAVLAHDRAAAGAGAAHVGWIVREACTRAGLPRVGAHRLRHTAATEMLRHGASLAEIGQVLRHREQKTTPYTPRSTAGRCARSRGRGRRRKVVRHDASANALADYLRLRRRLGFEMPQDGRLLEGFVEFLERAGAERITTELALEWATHARGRAPALWRQRLSVVRGFARHLATIDPASEVPSKDLLPGHRPRIAPYIYTEQEIRR